MRRSLRGLPILAFLLLVRIGAAATYTAATCNRADILTAIGSAASSGDTIIVPPSPPSSPCVWSSGISVGAKSVTLQGAGIGLTVVNLTGTTGKDGFQLGTTASRVTGFTFNLSASSTDVAVWARGQGFRFDHSRVVNLTGVNSKHMFFADGSTSAGIPHPTGVVDHNEGLNVRTLVHGNADLIAAAIWSLPSKIGGSTGLVFIETNTLERTNGTDDVADANYGGSYVFRYNTVTNGTIETHSVQGVGRGARSLEAYGNAFTSTAPARFTAIWARAGTAVAYDNTIVGYIWSIVLDNVRSFQSFAFPPGKCDGTSSWDGNTTLGWPCRDQVGRGADSSLWTVAPYPAQASEPAYFWNNTLNGSPAVPYVHNCTSAVKPSGSCADVVSGRDFINGTARPGYTAYQYPHPLVGSTPSISAPTNLRIVSP